MRFQLCLAILLLFFVANGVVYTWKMDREIDESARIHASHREQMAAETLSEAVDNRYDLLLPAPGTEFMTEGGLNWLKDTAQISPATGQVPLMRSSTRVTNAWMERFEILDWTFIVRVVLSFMAIAMAYNSVSEEVESGTLGIVLSHPISRARFAVAKLGSCLIVLLVPAVLGSLLSLLILSTWGHLDLGWVQARSWLLFMGATGLYVILFLCVAFGVSALLRNSAAALVFLVVCWMLLTVVIPQASYLIGITAVEAPGYGGPDGAYARMQQLSETTRRALEQEGIGLRGSDLGRVDDFAVEKRYAARMSRVDAERAAMVQQAEQELRAQFAFAKGITLASPGYAFTYGVEALLGTGVARLQHFYEQAWHYRDTLLDFLRSRDAADPASPHVLFIAQYMSQAPLDVGDLPRLQPTPLPLGESLAAGVVPLLVLVLEALLAFLFALWSINRTAIA